MSNASSAAGRSGASGAAETPENHGALVTKLRAALYQRGVKLAKWQAHRALCGQCQQVRPPAGPGQCCRAGRRLLEAFLAARQAAIDARGQLEPARAADQGRLF